MSRIEQVDRTTSSVKVAIDLDCIGLAGTEHEELEYQYWWGPKFNDDLNSIPLGVTVHEMSIIMRLLLRLSAQNLAGTFKMISIHLSVRK